MIVGRHWVVRESRLLSLLLLLEQRRAATATELAAHFEVSLRTIYRDMDALSAAGVPVYADRGPTGGYRLLPGYRARIDGLIQNGLTPGEAAALYLWGFPSAAANLGLGDRLADAERKVLAALPPGARPQARVVRERFHLDAPGWFGEDDQPAHLTAVADAVFGQHAVSVRYRRWRGEVTRTIEPLGLVLKGGVWYLVAAADGQCRIYRVSRILSLELLAQRFERPADFDLAAYWRSWSADFLTRMYQAEAVIRLSPRGRALLEHLFDRTTRQAAESTAGPPDADGWTRVVLPIESVEHAASNLLRLGTEAEVGAPEALRQRIAEIAGNLAARYAASRLAPEGRDSGGTCRGAP